MSLQRARVTIYSPAKNPMQSGKASKGKWRIKFDEEPHMRVVDGLMGWTGSKDMRQELNLQFVSKEEAVAYAKRHNLDYQVIEPHQSALHLQSYADNFTKKPITE